MEKDMKLSNDISNDSPLNIIPFLKKYNGILKFKSWEVILFTLYNCPIENRNTTYISRLTGYTYSTVWFTIRAFKSVSWVKEWTSPNQYDDIQYYIPARSIEFTDQGLCIAETTNMYIKQWTNSHLYAKLIEMVPKIKWK